MNYIMNCVNYASNIMNNIEGKKIEFYLKTGDCFLSKCKINKLRAEDQKALKRTTINQITFERLFIVSQVGELVGAY